MSTEARDRVGVIEKRGIEPVPDSERHGTAIEMFWLFFAINMGVLSITVGATLFTVYGLSLLQVLLATLLGVIPAFAIVGLIATAGKRGGAPGLTLSRAIFGFRGNWGPTFISWVVFVGWEIISCTTAAFALMAILGALGLQPSVPLTVVCVLVVIAITAVIGIFGHATVIWIQKWITIIFGTMTAVIVGFLLPTVNWSGVFTHPPAPAPAVAAGVGFVVAASGLTYLTAGADYARYFPKSVPAGRVVGATILSATPLVVLFAMGCLMAMGDNSLASASDPVSAIGAALPPWLLIPFLLTAMAGLITGADLGMYSSGLNLISAGIKVRRATAVAIDTVVIIAGALYITVVAQDFFGPFTTFLTLVAVPVAGWAAIFLVDLAGRKDYDPVALLDNTVTGRYWYHGGVNLPATLSWVLSIVLGSLFTRAASGEAEWFSGPMSGTWVGRNGFSWLITMISAALLYLVLRAVFRQESRIDPPAERQHAPAAAVIDRSGSATS